MNKSNTETRRRVFLRNIVSFVRTGMMIENPYFPAILTGQLASLLARILESLAGCRTMLPFAAFCKIGALERNAF